MHGRSEQNLRKICHSIRFPERILEDDGTKLVEHLNKQKAIFLSIEGSSSDIPQRIIHAFRDLEHIMNTKPYTFRAIQYERFYLLLWKLFTKRSLGYFNLWPLVIPEINIPQSILGKMIDEEYSRFNRGLKEATQRSNLVSWRRSSIQSSSSNEEHHTTTSALLHSSATKSSTIEGISI